MFIQTQSPSPRTRRAARILLPILVAASACTGDPGPAGPAGPQGPAGPAGSTASTPALVIKGAALDVHGHLASQSLTDRFTGGGVPASTGEELVARLDEANVQRAVVLAGGYMGTPVGITDDSHMAPENDFVAGEVGEAPDPVIGFCGINPLFGSAVAEIDRCLDLPGMVGVKLHLPGSGIDMTRPSDVAAVAAVFDKIARPRRPGPHARGQRLRPADRRGRSHQPGRRHPRPPWRPAGPRALRGAAGRPGDRGVAARRRRHDRPPSSRQAPV